MRCLREYFGLCHLNGKNYLLCTPGILFIQASLAQPPSHKLSREESWWFFSTAIMDVIYYLKNVQIHGKVFWTNAEWSVSSAGGLGCSHLSGYICNSARQQVHSCPRWEEFWRKVVPGVLYFTLGTAKACLVANRWIPVWVCHVEKMVAPFQRKEGTAAVGDLLPKRSWEKTESIFTRHPTLPGRVLGVWATAFAGCNSLSV